MKPLSIRRLDPYRIEIEKQPPMRTRGIIYANAKIERVMEHENVFEQVANVAHLPGIVGPSIAMPDIHWGYGFPIGGVAAFDLEEGIISPGGVGYDINCGVCCLTSNLSREEVTAQIDRLLPSLFRNIPSGVGSSNRSMEVGTREFRDVLEKGSLWSMKKGYLPREDIDAHEEKGCITGADPEAVSARAIERGQPQLGTLGSGNHFLELDVVDRIMDDKIAKSFGLFEGQVVVQIHTGSRGLGHQICDEHVHAMLRSIQRYGIELPDRQLACAPVQSREGREYFSAMACAANFAFANRDMIACLVRETFEQCFGKSCGQLGMRLLYDCCHNIAKMEKIDWEGSESKVCIHRKGATRALPPGDPRLPDRFARTGQPVLVPGDMGRMSFVLAGARGAHETFFSACHGAGRVLSRHEAKKRSRGREIVKELLKHDIHAMAASRATLAEEIPEAYKDVSDVVETIAGAGIAVPVARLKPFAIMKG